MAISFDKALGIHPHALQFRSERADVLANNLANADTPGFKARDLDFARALDNAMSGKHFHLQRTHERHMAGPDDLANEYALAFRAPIQPDTGDGNTVDSHTEQAAFAENAVQFQVSFTFLNSKFRGLLSAIRGE